MELTTVNCNSNGHPRKVVHFLALVNKKDEIEADRRQDVLKPFKFSTSHLYDIALSKAKAIHGRKFHNNQYGGGIVFVCWEPSELIEKINRVKNS